MTTTSASDAFRTPSLFRYPGGKTWLLPYLWCWLESFSEKPSLFFEPFAGGAVASLTVAEQDLARRILMVELDPDVASVWKTVLNSQNSQWLAERISSFCMSRENVDALLAVEPTYEWQIAFRTIVRNRVNRGGILAPGAGMINEGERSKGLMSRWYPQTLVKRIARIQKVRQRIKFVEGDGLRWIRRLKNQSEVYYFIDPPYTASDTKVGARLYRFSELNHHALWTQVAETKGQFLMTYDDRVEVRDLIAEFGFESRSVLMKNTHHMRKSELLIARNLTWFDSAFGEQEIVLN
jgi:DNA adenine methylase